MAQPVAPPPRIYRLTRGVIRVRPDATAPGGGWCVLRRDGGLRTISVADALERGYIEETG
jgi:hypothetical protein